MNKFEQKNNTKSNSIESKKKITLLEMSNLDPQNFQKEGNLANVVYMSMLMKGDHYFTEESLINHLISSGNEGSAKDRLSRAQKTVSNFINQGYLALDQNSKIISLVELE